MDIAVVRGTDGSVEEGGDGLKLGVGVALELIHKEAKAANQEEGTIDGEKTVKDVSRLHQEVQEVKRQMRLMTSVGREENVVADGYDVGDGQCQLRVQRQSTSGKSSTITLTGLQDQIIRLEQQLVAVDGHVRLICEHLHRQDTR